VGVSFGGGTGGGVWLLVSTASAALYIHYSVYVLEPGVVASADSAFPNNVWKIGGACSYPASAHRNIHDSVRQYFSMTGSKRVFLGCWVSLDKQDRLCEVSLDRSAVKEVSRPSEQQIDSIFQACKSCMNPTINKLLT
jgi:hypothetical protein